MINIINKALAHAGETEETNHGMMGDIDLTQIGFFGFGRFFMILLLTLAILGIAALAKWLTNQGKDKDK